VIFRSSAGNDFERFAPLLVEDPASYVTPDRYAMRIRSGEHRPGWTWIAKESADGPVLAVAAWWGLPQESLPGSLDSLSVAATLSSADRVGIAAGLLRAAHEAYARAGATEPPAYHVFLPADWRDQPDAVAAFTWRQQAARQAGLTETLERFSYEWATRDGLPDPSKRLVFRAEPDDGVFVGLFRRVLEGTLDATSRKEAATMGAEPQARQDVAFYQEKMAGERAWWRVAATPDGEVVGFGIPSRNTEFPVVGYLGVLPEHRGHGYGDDILAEITRILAIEAGAEVIRADTDLENRPMAAAFERVGYRNTASHLVLFAP
jgi:GNAT superfamily N-acetyltransferase